MTKSPIIEAMKELVDNYDNHVNKMIKQHHEAIKETLKMTSPDSITSIKAELDRIDEARAKATQGEWKPELTTSYNVKLDKDEIVRTGWIDKVVDYKECGSHEALWTIEANLDFTCLAANEILNLTKALSVAVQDIERLKFALQMMIIQFNGNVPGMTKQQVFDSAMDARDMSTANVKSIAEILSGGGENK